MLLLELKFARLADDKESKESVPDNVGPWVDSQVASSVCLSIKSHFISVSYAAVTTGHHCFLSSFKSSPTSNSVINLGCAWELLSRKAMWTSLCRTWVNRLSLWWEEKNEGLFLMYDEVCVGISSDFTIWWSSSWTQCSLSVFGGWGGRRRHRGDVEMINTETDAESFQNNYIIIFYLFWTC